MAEYSMPTDESLVRVAKAIEAGNGLLQRVTGGYVLFTSTKPAESSITAKPCLVIVTTTGEMYLVADDLVEQTGAKEDAWPDEEEAKQNFSWGEGEEPTTDLADSKAAVEGAGPADPNATVAEEGAGSTSAEPTPDASETEAGQ